MVSPGQRRAPALAGVHAWWALAASDETRVWRCWFEPDPTHAVKAVCFQNYVRDTMCAWLCCMGMQLVRGADKQSGMIVHDVPVNAWQLLSFRWCWRLALYD